MRYLALALLLALLGCQPPVPAAPGPMPWAVTPEMAAAATYKVLVTVEYTPYQMEPMEGHWSGTAWVVRNTGGAAELVTAGHVCHMDEGLTFKRIELMDVEGIKYPASITRYTEEPDVCLLAAVGHLGPPLPVSFRDPTWGEGIGYVGAPQGYWGEGMMPLHFGRYAGGDMITAPVAPGASGSAVFGRDGVIGIVARVRMDFHVAAFITTRAELAEFLDTI